MFESLETVGKYLRTFHVGIFRILSVILEGAFCKNSGFQPLTIFEKSSILDVWQDSKHVSVTSKPK